MSVYLGIGAGRVGRVRVVELTHRHTVDQLVHSNGWVQPMRKPHSQTTEPAQVTSWHTHRHTHTHMQTHNVRDLPLTKHGRGVRCSVHVRAAAACARACEEHVACVCVCVCVIAHCVVSHV